MRSLGMIVAALATWLPLSAETQSPLPSPQVQVRALGVRLQQPYPPGPPQEAAGAPAAPTTSGTATPMGAPSSPVRAGVRLERPTGWEDPSLVIRVDLALSAGWQVAQVEPITAEVTLDTGASLAWTRVPPPRTVPAVLDARPLAPPPQDPAAVDLAFPCPTQAARGIAGLHGAMRLVAYDPASVEAIPVNLTPGVAQGIGGLWGGTLTVRATPDGEVVWSVASAAQLLQVRKVEYRSTLGVLLHNQSSSAGLGAPTAAFAETLHFYVQVPTQATLMCARTMRVLEVRFALPALPLLGPPPAPIVQPATTITATPWTGQ